MKIKTLKTLELCETFSAQLVGSCTWLSSYYIL